MRNTILSGLAMLLAGPVVAQSQTSCFCLLNPGTQMIERWGCEARLIATRGIERIRCQTPTFDGRDTIQNVERFTQIPDGDGQCVPCYQSARGDVTDDIRELEPETQDDPEEDPADE